MTDHPLPSPPFTDRERAAYDWLVASQKNIQWWWFDYPGEKKVAWMRGNYDSVVAFAKHLGWEGRMVELAEEKLDEWGDKFTPPQTWYEQPEEDLFDAPPVVEMPRGPTMTDAERIRDLEAEVERLRCSLEGRDKAIELLNKGFESACADRDRMKQRIRELEEER